MLNRMGDQSGDKRNMDRLLQDKEEVLMIKYQTNLTQHEFYVGGCMTCLK